MTCGFWAVMSDGYHLHRQDSQTGEDSTTYGVVLPTVEPEFGQTFISKCQFVGNSEDGGAWYVTPWEYSVNARR